MPVLTAIGTIGSLILSGVGLGLDVTAGQQASKVAGRRRREDNERNEAWKEREFDLRKDELDWTKGQADRTWKWKEEDRDYGRSQDFVNRLTGMLDRDVGFKDRLMDIWGSK